MNMADISLGMRVRTRWLDATDGPREDFVSEAGTVTALMPASPSILGDIDMVDVTLDVDGTLLPYVTESLEPVPTFAVGDRVRTLRTSRGGGWAWQSLTGEVVEVRPAGSDDNPTERQLVNVRLDASGVVAGLTDAADWERIITVARCPECGGTGLEPISGAPCRPCRGQGERSDRERV